MENNEKVNNNARQREQMLKELEELYTKIESSKKLKKKIKEAGEVEDIVVNNALKLEVKDYDILQSIISKSAINKDISIINSAIETNKKQMKNFLDLYTDIKEEIKEITRFIENITQFENYERYEQEIQKLEDKLARLELRKKDITKKLEEAVDSLGHLKNHSLTKDLISAKFGKAMLKGNYSTELHNEYIKSLEV